MSYFNHRYASNSDIKEIVARHEGRTKPENIKEIFAFGTEFHAGILEPNRSDLSRIQPEQAELIKAMSNTFWKDDLCRRIVMAPDFRREHEFYRTNRFGVGARCKTDGVSKKLQVILELKGLSITTEKSFRESILHLDYDQGAAWYLNVASSDSWLYHYKLIVGISKKEPDRLFKVIIDRKHPFYASGIQKVNYGVNLWKNVYGFN